MTKERIKELRKFVEEINENARIDLNVNGRAKVADLLALLDEKKKAEAENDRLATDLSHHQHDLLCEEQDRKKAEAELEAQRPLIEAVMAVPKDYVSMCPYIAEHDDYWHDVHRAALKFREGRAATPQNGAYAPNVGQAAEPANPVGPIDLDLQAYLDNEPGDEAVKLSGGLTTAPEADTPGPLPKDVEEALMDVDSVIAYAGGLTDQGRKDAFTALRTIRAALTTKNGADGPSVRPMTAPTLSDLRGIAPDATGDLSSEEFVRRIRQGWTPPWKAPTSEEERNAWRRAQLAKEYMWPINDNKPAPTSAERKEMLFNMERVKRHVPFDVWDKIRTLILAEPAQSSVVSGQEVSIPCEKKVVSREWLHDTAIILCCVGTRVDHIEQDLEARLSELGVEVEGEKP